MKKMYTTAMGKNIDLDSLRIANEQTIAVGNMKVNAKGEELGPGGSIKASRAQMMEEHYRLEAAEQRGRANKQAQNRKAGASSKVRTAPVNVRETTEGAPMQQQRNHHNNTTPVESEGIESADQTETTAPEESAPNRRMRGSLANSIAKESTVTQDLMPDPRRPKGPSRI